MNASTYLSIIVRRLRDRQGMSLAETMVASAIGAFILVGVMTTYIVCLRSFAAIANYDRMHSDGRLAVTYFAKDMRAVSGITSFPNSSNITVSIPTAFNTSGAAISNKTVSYTTSGGGL